MKTKPIEIVVVGDKRVQVYFDRPNSNRSFQYTREDARKIGAWGFKTGNMLDMMYLCVEQSVQVLSTGEIILTYDNSFITLKDQSVEFMVAIYQLLAHLPDQTPEELEDDCNQLQKSWALKRLMLAKAEVGLINPPTPCKVSLNTSQYICPRLASVKVESGGEAEDACVELLNEIDACLRAVISAEPDGEVTVERVLDELKVPVVMGMERSLAYYTRLNLMRGYTEKGFDFRVALTQAIKQHLTVADKIELNKALPLMELLAVRLP